MSNIGMMDGAFFVGRKELVDWVNTTLQLNIGKIEDTAQGAIACQMLDIMYPNTVPMHKVNWSANKDFEYVANYKVLQTCFTKLKIDKFVDVDRLIKGKYQDNLEFMQWFKRFFEMSVTDIGDYDAFGQRSKGKGGAAFGMGAKTVSRAARPTEVKKVSAPVKKPVASSTASKENTAPTRAAVKTAAGKTSAAVKSVSKPAAQGAADSTANDAEVTSLKASNEALNKQCAEMKIEMDGLITERDFYFDKLRDVEMMLQEMEDAGKGTDLSAAIFKILYATADGFESEQKEETTPETVAEAVLPVEESEPVAEPAVEPVAESLTEVVEESY